MSTLYAMVISASVAGIPLSSMAQTADERISWSVAAALPPADKDHQNPGVAGPFAGVSGDVLLVAGGANFPHGKPWEGGKKAYTDEIYVVKREKQGFECRLLNGIRLPEKTAYGSSVTTPMGVVCIGGETASGYSAKVFLLKWEEDERVSIEHLPDLPVGLANACAAAIGTRIYVAGGEDARRPLAGCYALDLAAGNPVWEELPPLPLALSHSVAVTQTDGKKPCIYIIGGRSKTDSGISDLHYTVFRFDPGKHVWERLADIREGSRKVNLSAACAVPCKNGIIVIGGDRGDIFHRIEVHNAKVAHAKSSSAAAYNTRKKLELVLNHPGFSHAIMEYEVRGNRWKKIGILPGDPQVTTTAVLWGGAVFIPCGEIRPGVRTPEIWKGEFCYKQ